MKTSSIPFALALGLTASFAALAQTSPARTSSNAPLWEAGVGMAGVSQQAYPGSDQQVKRGFILPYVAYRGQYLRADRDGVQVRGYFSDNIEIDFSFAASLGASSSQIDARAGLPNLGTLIEGGPRVRWKLGAAPWGGQLQADLPLRGVFDLSNRLAFKGLVLEPEIAYAGRSANGIGYKASLSASVGNQRLNDTFYGVAPGFASADRPAYVAQSGLISTRLSLGATKSVSQNWRIFGFTRLENLAGAANTASPLVKQKHGVSGGFGLVYTFYRSEAKASN